MSLIKILQDYQKGFAVYDSCHKQDMDTQWQAFNEELAEFKAEFSWDEFWDICHSFGRVVYRLTGISLQILALPTVIKHSKRYSQRGCVRSERNCQGKCCSIESLT